MVNGRGWKEERGRGEERREEGRFFDDEVIRGCSVVGLFLI